MLEFPFKIMGNIIENMSINYTSTLEKMYILNPSFIFNTTWKVVESNLNIIRNASSRNCGQNNTFKNF